MGTEHSANERMHRLLDGALDDVEFDADVVPAVLADYGRDVRFRRYRAAGTAVAALAVLAVAATAAGVLPRSGSGTTRPAGPTTPTLTAAPTPADFQNSGCHQHWAMTYDDSHFTGGNRLSDHQGADEANCQALLTALHSVFPAANLEFHFNPNLTLDARIDQAQLKQFTDLQLHSGQPGAANAAMPAFSTKLQNENEYLRQHPEDPANVADPTAATLATPAGRETFLLTYGTTPPVPGNDFPTDCANEPSDFKKYAGCTALRAGAWHGALTWATKLDDDFQYTMAAVLTDDHGHYVHLNATGADDAAWEQATPPDAGGRVDPQTTRWINNRTHQERVGGSFAPKSPALNEKQYAQLYTSPGFAAFLDEFLAYKLAHPGQVPPHATR